MHILREGRAASGWHKGGRSYGVSTTPLPKSALALPSNLPTYHPCTRARLWLETLDSIHPPTTLSLLSRIFLVGPSRCLGAILSCSMRHRRLVLGAVSYERRECKRSLQGCRNNMVLLESVARVARDWNTRRGRPGTDEFDVPSGPTW